MMISIDSIRIIEGRRNVDMNKVKELAESIKQIGLINPITVRHDAEYLKYVLVAGRHRLEAYKLLGKEQIEANVVNGTDVEMELIEIDENLIRNELHYIEIDDLTARRKEIYEEMYPETKVGSCNKSNNYGRGLEKTESDFSKNSQYTKVLKTNSDDSKPSFVTDTSNKTGKSETVIKEEVFRANNLIPEAKETLREQNITKTEATKLAREEPEVQEKVVELFSTGEVKKVDEAKSKLDIQTEEGFKKIDEKYDRIKLVSSLINNSKFQKIDKEHIEDYLEKSILADDFIKNCDKMIDKLNEMKSIYSKSQMIRRVK